MSDGRRSRIEEIGDDSRRRILDAAESLFLERGVEHTSFVDIGERSGISRGSIPWHFQNKEGLVIAVIERAAARHMITNGGDPPSALGLRESMKRLTKWLHDPASAMLYTVLVTAVTTDGAVHDRYVDLNRSWRRDFLVALRAWGAGDGPSDAELEPIAAVLNGALIGMHLHWHIDRQVDFDGGMATLTEMLALAIRAE